MLQAKALQLKDPITQNQDSLIIPKSPKHNLNKSTKHTQVSSLLFQRPAPPAPEGHPTTCPP